jgi:hypothetical protein
MGGHDHHGPAQPPNGLLRDTFQKPRPTEYALSEANRIILMDEITDVIKDETRWKMEYSMLELLLLMALWLSEFTVLMLLSLQYR